MELIRQVDPQGRKASLFGRELENVVEEILSEKGIYAINYTNWVNDVTSSVEIMESMDSKGVLLKRVPYTRFHGGNGIGEFVLIRDGKKDIRIECRLQNVAGSADDKLAALQLDAEAFDEKEVIIVLEGYGFKNSVVRWFKDKCESIKYKSIKVLNLNEFVSWAESELK